MRRVAVLLNRNAQRVTDKLVAWMRAQVPPDDVYVCATLDEARAAAGAIAERGFEAACIGGGDGTFAQAARDFLALGRVPLLHPLRLGSGNAIHDVCGSGPRTRRGLAADLARAAGDEPPSALRLLDVDGQLAHFTGVGIDAAHVEDVRGLIKEKLGRGFFAPLFRGIPGIALTAVARTVPRLFREAPWPLRIVNLGAPAQRFDDGGGFTGDPIAPGEIIYDGPATIAAAATIAQYSRGLRFFPFVDGLRDRFQLRVSHAAPLHIIWNLRRVFAGTYRDPTRLWDYAVSRVRLEAPEPLPFHVGGDFQERTRGVTIALSDQTVPILRAPG